MSFNCEHFINEFKEYVEKLGIRPILEIGCLSGELKDAVGADGIDINPGRDDVIKTDIREFKPRRKYWLAFSSGLLEHYTEGEAVKILEAAASVVRKNGFVLSYVPNSGCEAYIKAKGRSKASWKDEIDYTPEGLAALHEAAGLEVADMGYAGAEWAKRFGPEESEPYLVYVLAKKVV